MPSKSANDKKDLTQPNAESTINSPTHQERKSKATASEPSRGQKSRMRTRQKLIESAQRAMATKGFEQTTIEDITKGADVGFGTFYNHFSSKEDIATALFLDQIREIGCIIDEINGKEADRAVSIAYIQKLLLKKAVSNEVWGWFIVRAHSSHKIINDAFNERAITDIAEGVARGRFDVSCINTAAQITISGLIAVMRSLLEGDARPGVASETVECLMRMYGLDHDDAKRISELDLPEYVSTLFKN